MQVTPPRSLGELFLGFLAIGARSFGGVLPWAYRTMVEERRWLTQADFAETIGLCQFLPGPNIGNASIVLGKRLREEHAADVLVMGCAGMARYRKGLQEAVGVPVVEPTQAAVSMAIGRVRVNWEGV